jgi:hypothetical protein
LLLRPIPANGRTHTHESLSAQRITFPVFVVVEPIAIHYFMSDATAFPISAQLGMNFDLFFFGFMVPSGINPNSVWSIASLVRI